VAASSGKKFHADGKVGKGCELRYFVLSLSFFFFFFFVLMPQTDILLALVLLLNVYFASSPSSLFFADTQNYTILDGPNPNITFIEPFTGEVATVCQLEMGQWYYENGYHFNGSSTIIYDMVNNSFKFYELPDSLSSKGCDNFLRKQVGGPTEIQSRRGEPMAVFFGVGGSGYGTLLAVDYALTSPMYHRLQVCV